MMNDLDWLSSRALFALVEDLLRIGTPAAIETARALLTEADKRHGAMGSLLARAKASLDRRGR